MTPRDHSSTRIFTVKERDRIDAALEDALSIDSPADRAGIIDEIERSGAVRVFGYMSLISNPHTQTDAQIDARLEGYKRSFCVMDIFYKGTPEYPGLTMGLDATDADGAEIPGQILETSRAASETQGADFTDRVVEFIEKLGKRENPPTMPVYAFKLLDVATDDGRSVKAITCVADEDGPLYVGDTLSLDEKAAIIATACAAKRTSGPYANDKTPGKRPNLDYLRFVAQDAEKQGTPLEPEIAALLDKANAYRQAMPEERRKKLEALEKKTRDKKFYKPSKTNRFSGMKPDMADAFNAAARKKLKPRPDNPPKPPRPGV